MERNPKITATLSPEFAVLVEHRQFVQAQTMSIFIAAYDAGFAVDCSGVDLPSEPDRQPLYASLAEQWAVLSVLRQISHHGEAFAVDLINAIRKMIGTGTPIAV